MSEQQDRILIIGAGPAGLTAGLELVRNGFDVTIAEAGDKVGGISRTEEYKGYKFDLGGHRFFSKNKDIVKYWKEILGEDLLIKKRKSRILYKNKYFNYPLSFFEALRKLGIINSIKALLSYFRYQLMPLEEYSYADWMTNKFGKYLFDTFFKTYTEKVWGISVYDISKDWALQRVKTLSLRNAVLDSIFKSKRNKITTLTNTFFYPKFGPGQMWERIAQEFQHNGGKILFNTRINKLILDKSGEWRVLSELSEITQSSFNHVISTMPLRSLIKAIGCNSKTVLKAANSLKYRDFIMVVLIISKKEIFDDNWIYIHDTSVKVGRIQNFKNWSEHMVPDQNKTALGMEYFFFEEDAIWNYADKDLIHMAKSELVKLGMVTEEEIEDGKVVKLKKAYPVYDNSYKENIRIIREYLDKLNNLHVIGRNGMHRYNNQDHSMVTALIVAENIINGEKVRDEWNVSNDAEYIEVETHTMNLELTGSREYANM